MTSTSIWIWNGLLADPYVLLLFSMHADNVWSTQSYAEEKKCQVTQSVNSWLNQARLEWARDTDASVESWRTWQMAPPTSDESSINSGGQADDEPEIQSPLSP